VAEHLEASCELPHRGPLRRLKQQGRAALVTFLTAGDPDYATSLAILQGLPRLAPT